MAAQERGAPLLSVVTSPLLSPAPLVWASELTPRGTRAARRWQRTIEYTLRVALAAAASSLLVLYGPLCDSLHPASDTVKFLFPVFAILVCGRYPHAPLFAAEFG